MSAVPMEATGALPASGTATAKDRPRWMWAVWLATIGYLVWELSFNARLLDVVGGNATSKEIDSIEIWGRMISGFALALLGWPWCIRIAWRKFRSVFALLVVLGAWTMAAMIGMYVAQEALIRTLVDRATPQELVEAQHLMLLRSGIEAGVVELPGLDIERDRLKAADGKAFLAMFPMLGTGLGAIVSEQFSPAQRADVTRRLAVHAMGDPNEHLQRYGDLLRELESGYRTYGESLSEIDAKGEKAWRDYVRKLRSNRRWTPTSVPRRHYGAVRSRVRDMGVWVPDDWRPSDKAGFLKAATEDGRRQAHSTFVSELVAKSPKFQGVTLPDTFDGFVTGKETQGHLLSALGYECIRNFDPAMTTAAQFKTRVYDAEVECQAARQQEKEGELEAGKEAMRGLLVPMIALALSLLGALTHIGKVSLLTTRLAKGRELANQRQLYRWVFAGPLVAMLLFAWVPLSEISETSLYRNLERHIRYPTGLVVRGTIHGQHVGYPVFEATRVHLLRGFDFGYKGDADEVRSSAKQ